MSEPEESEELRSLQARAYGRDASLTADEAVRLRELEERRLVRPVEAADAPVDDGPAMTVAAETERRRARRDAGVPFADGGPQTPHAEDGLEDRGPGADESEADAGEGAATPPASRRSLRSALGLLRAHWRPVALATAVVLAVGLGIGWLAFGRSGAEPVALTAEQQGWQNDLISGGLYDSGSIRALGVEEGAVIWTATKDGRERTCLILSTGAVTLPTCERTETVAEAGIYGSITVEATDDRQRQVSVQMLYTAAGEPAVAVSAYDYDPVQNGITYATDEESAIAQRLADDGYDAGSLWVVGYDGDVPVWTAIRSDSQNRCLIYDGSTDEAPVTCADLETMQDVSSSLVLTVDDADTGGTTTLELASNQGPGYLVITREGGIAGAGGD